MTGEHCQQRLGASGDLHPRPSPQVPSLTSHICASVRLAVEQVGGLPHQIAQQDMPTWWATRFSESNDLGPRDPKCSSPKPLISRPQGTQVAVTSGGAKPPLSQLAHTWWNFPDWGAGMGEVSLLDLVCYVSFWKRAIKRNAACSLGEGTGSGVKGGHPGGAPEQCPSSCGSPPRPIWPRTQARPALPCPPG